MQHNLRMERELQFSINNQLEEELSIAQIEHMRLGEIERIMNE